MKRKRVNSRFAKTRRALLFWTLFIGFGAVAGASGMLLDPTGKAMGMDAMLPYFQVLPLAEYLYQDFLFPGIALLIVNGLTNLTAASEIVFTGTPREMAEQAQTITAEYLRKSI